MLLKYKNIGDTLSLDEYNAIVYLLMRYNQISENIDLNDIFNGTFGDYSLVFEDEQLNLMGNVYEVLDNTGYITLTIDTEFVAQFNLKLSHYLSPYEEASQEIIDPEEHSETIESTPENIIVNTYYSTDLGNRKQITIPLTDFSVGEYILMNATIDLQYNGPVIDKLSGPVNTDNLHTTIKTAEDLVYAIQTAPVNEVTTLYLEPGLEYVLYDEDSDDCITIENNKTIKIISGSLPSILNADNMFRHFYIEEQGILELENITLMNGLSKEDTNYPGKGGSIYIHSEYVTVEGVNVKELGQLICTNCTFSDNRATTGGAIYNEDGLASFTNSTFYNNLAKSSSNVLGQGGAIYNEGIGGT